MSLTNTTKTDISNVTKFHESIHKIGFPNLNYNFIYFSVNQIQHSVRHKYFYNLLMQIIMNGVSPEFIICVFKVQRALCISLFLINSLTDSGLVYLDDCWARGAASGSAVLLWQAVG